MFSGCLRAGMSWFSRIWEWELSVGLGWGYSLPTHWCCQLGSKMPCLGSLSRCAILQGCDCVLIVPRGGIFCEDALQSRELPQSSFIPVVPSSWAPALLFRPLGDAALQDNKSWCFQAFPTGDCTPEEMWGGDAAGRLPQAVGM